ncbi:alpha/beta fold hydrolase [Anderseniella sp. Alg231-50]|uniref:alpha/beta fold hydrolase n=1 Tax=Anderseniella sp. Alg231-50 TaxID=1922226 RepID=UPI000D55BF29
MPAPTPLLQDGPATGPILLLAHGAGAPMDSDFMTEMAGLLAGCGVHVVRFEFAYMRARRTDGKRRPPPRMPGLIDEFQQVMSRFPDGPVFIGGKSMGGRVASMIAADPQDGSNIAGLACLGYPFHPPGKPDSLRTQHLPAITCPALIVQGERDPFGNKDDVAGYELPANMQVFWSASGNHDLTPPKKSGRTAQENWTEAAQAISGFIDGNT